MIVLAVTYVVNAMDRSVFPVLLTSVDADYGFSLGAGGFLATVFTLGLGAGGIPSGYLFARWRRKTIAIAGIIIYSSCTILTCVSLSFYDMALYRAVSGIGEAFQNVAIFSMAGAYFAQNRTLAFGILNLAYATGSFIGPRWAAHLLADYGSWRLSLIIYGVIGLLGAAAFARSIPAAFSESRPGAVARRKLEGSVPKGLFNRNTILITVASAAGGLAAYGYLGLYPTYLRTELHFSVEEAATAASMYGVGAAMGIVCGYLADRVNQKWLAILALLALNGASYAIFNVATTLQSHELLSFVMGAAFSGFFYINNYSLMQRSVQPEIVGSASGLMVAAVNLPAAISGYLMAELVTGFGWSTAQLLQMSLLPAIATVGLGFLSLNQTSRGTDAQAEAA